jgi:histidinol-phosphatase (PHP family)
MWTNYHTHSDYCDGKATVADVVATARTLRMPAIGISSHAPLPFERKWCMKPSQLDNYISEIQRARDLHKSIEVYAGVEADFIPQKMSPAAFRKRLDYVIGSVHFVDELKDGQGWEIDGTYQDFVRGLEEIFHGNMKDAVSRYLELTRQMVTEGAPDIVGHLDKIKMQNKDRSQFDEADLWYRSAIRDTLTVIRDAGSIVEVNTRGVYQRKTTTIYPSPWVIGEMRKMQIPVTLSSDAHHPDDLVNGFTQAAETLLHAGIKKIRILSEGKWRDVAFDEHGIKNYKVAD